MTMKHNIGVVKDVILVVKKDVECVSKAMKKKLTVKEALEIADHIITLMEDFKLDIENGRDDPENNVDGWKDEDEVKESYFEDGMIDIMKYYRQRY